MSYGYSMRYKRVMTLIRKLQKFTDHIKRGTANSFTQKKATKKTALRTPSPYPKRIITY